MKKDDHAQATKVGVKDGQDKTAEAPKNPVEARTTEEKDRDDERRPNVPDERDPERPEPDVAATYADPEGQTPESVGHVRPADAYHKEPSSYTPAGARPGQQNPVNPQGSPNADPHAREVGARPEQAPVLDQGFNGDFIKVMTEGEKNPSQLPVDVDRQEYKENAPWTHEDSTRERKMREARGE